MSSQNIRKMVISALLIALAIVFQQLRPMLGGPNNPVSTYIIGSLVNLCLIVAAITVGLWGGIAVSVVTPLIALMQSQTTPQMMPWIIAGNAALVVAYALFSMKDKNSLSIKWIRWSTTGIIAALLKFVIITFGMYVAMTHSMIVAIVKQYIQIITAVIAMVLGGIILPMLPKKVIGKNA